MRRTAGDLVRAAAAMLAALLLTCAPSAGVAPSHVHAATGVHLDAGGVGAQHATLAPPHRHAHPPRLGGTAAATLGGATGAQPTNAVETGASTAGGRPAGRSTSTTRTRAPPA